MPTTAQLESVWQTHTPRPDTIGGWLFRGIDGNGDVIHHVTTGSDVDWAALGPILATWREYACKPLPVGDALLS